MSKLAVLPLPDVAEARSSAPDALSEKHVHWRENDWFD